ncbi:App1 family protein [Actinotalea sp. K2]|uniref:App1 family protein n=1 Tax=Actinotalea sp. K2 TaxID=2939438 RepID=UPI002016C0B3|nr:phosphatase domain-containing protein [Actinotalea sp. K2]MCL3862406.1 DUF2183 domain-containing protein [Actinotalea sp. K2]
MHSHPARSGTSSSRPHRAARLEDRAYVLVARWLRRRGWVPRVVTYTGYGSTGWVRVMGRALLAAPGTRASEAAEQDRASQQRAVRGWRSFFTAQIPRARVEVQVGDRTHVLLADRGGYVDAVVESDLPPGWHTVTLQVGDRPVPADVLVIGEEPDVALVSDIDDTVMVTALPRPLIAAWNALVLHESARRVVPGMSDLYRRWHAAHPGAPVLYLSTGAWNVAPALRRFLTSHGFPAGPLLLTDWGPTNTGWFRSGQEHKHEQLDRLMRELPQLTWVLVGDDGQHDPEIYAEVARRHPGRVRVIALRELSPAEQVLAHGTTTPSRDTETSTGSPVQVGAPDGVGLARAMEVRGLL